MLWLRNNPWFVPLLFPQHWWHFSRKEKTIYLTFDDGPIPEVTEWVLNTLASYQAKATFFCIGNNIEKHPAIFQRIVEEGHRVGNHTFNHLKGWKTDLATYLENTESCHQIMAQLAPEAMAAPLLFRAPYLRISKEQTKVISKNYKLVFFDYITEDYELSLDPATCARWAIKGIKPGSIVIMHDSLKAEPRLKTTLPAILSHFSAKGFSFKALP